MRRFSNCDKGRPKKTMLLTGGSGLLGQGVISATPQGYLVVNAHLRDYPITKSSTQNVVLDVRDARQVDQLFARNRFDVVIHAAGIADVDYSQRHSKESWESNFNGTANIVSACLRSGTYLIYVSTNAVFDGAAAPYAETAAVRPINEYGRIKAACEDHVLSACASWCVVRPILMYGWNHPAGRPNMATWILDSLSKRKVIHIVDDVYENPIWNRDCGRVLWRIVQLQAVGIVHVAGPQTVHRFEFASRLANAFGFDTSPLRSVDSSYFPGIAPRPKNSSLLTNRMTTELDFAPASIDDGFRSMTRERFGLSQLDVIARGA